MQLNQKKVVLLFPPCTTKTFGKNGGAGTKQEKTIAPPLGLLYLAAELMDSGYLVEVIDFNAEPFSIDRLKGALTNASVAGVSMLSFNLDEAKSLIKGLIELYPEIPVIAGGPDLILRPRYIEGTRASVCHEAESIIVPLVNAIINNEDLSSVPGIFYKDSMGDVKSGAEFRLTHDLDSIKFPRRELVRDNDGYSVIGRKQSRKTTTIITSRGCPKKCRFCAHGAIAYSCFRQRSAENVLDEIKQIVDAGYDIIGIVDDNFTADKTRALKIARGIKALNAKLSIGVQGRVDAADEELFEALRDAGVKMITFGLESGNQQALDFYEKGTTVSMNAAAIKMADRMGMYTGGLFILGAPVEQIEHFNQTYHFAASLPLDVTSFWVLDYAYGSPLWKDAYRRGIVEEHENIVPAGSERGTQALTTKEITEICEKFFFRFYRRPSYWYRQVIKFIRIRDRHLMAVLVAGLQWLIIRKLEMLWEKMVGGVVNGVGKELQT
jgi:anaerobic magnesium-protoporphyrin IX monomethyl ester cyclase